MKLTKLLPMASLLLMTACAGNKDKDDTIQSTIKTLITPDRSKLFTYYGVVPQQKARKTKASGYDDLQEETTSKRGKKFEKERRSLRRQLLKDLEQKLALMNYCQQDYLFLEEQLDRNTGIIRGECRDTATEADMRQFPNPEDAPRGSKLGLTPDPDAQI